MRMALNRESPIPLYRQIRENLTKQIKNGQLGVGMRLPAIREMADSLGVTKGVVESAFAELESDGLVERRHGSGTYVVLLGQDTLDQDGVNHNNLPDWQAQIYAQSWQSTHIRIVKLINSLSQPNSISFVLQRQPGQLWPANELARIWKQVLKWETEDIVDDSSDPAGYMPLRRTISDILNTEGTPAHPDHVLITYGSQQALNMVSRILIRPGDVVLVESPSYYAGLDIFRSLGARLVGLPVDENGMQTNNLEEALRTYKPRLIYTIPTFHHPTGTCMSVPRRQQLVNLAAIYNTPILEDDYVGSLRYEGQSLPTIKSLDRGMGVIYVGTFSKTVMPSLRLGYVLTEGPLFQQLVSDKSVSDLMTSYLLQRALDQYITVGRYRSRLRALCKLNRTARDTLVTALKRYMPQGTYWQIPQGGRYVWVELPNKLSSDDLLPIAAREGVTFMPGSYCLPDNAPSSYMQLNFAINPVQKIEVGVKRLARATRSML